MKKNMFQTTNQIAIVLFGYRMVPLSDVNVGSVSPHEHTVHEYYSYIHKPYSYVSWFIKPMNTSFLYLP